MFNFKRLSIICLMSLVSSFFGGDDAKAQSNYCVSVQPSFCGSELAIACDAERRYAALQRNLTYYSQFGIHESQLETIVQFVFAAKKDFVTKGFAADSCIQKNKVSCDAPNESVSGDGTTCVCNGGFQRSKNGQCEAIELCQPNINLKPSQEIRMRNDGRYISNSGQCFLRASCASGTLSKLTSNLFVCKAGQEVCNDEYRPVCAHRRVECKLGTCYEVARSFDNSCRAREAKNLMILNGVCPTANFCATGLQRNEALNICVMPTGETKQPPLIIKAPVLPSPPVDKATPGLIAQPVLRPSPKVPAPPMKDVECDDLFIYDEVIAGCVPDRDKILQQVCRAKRLVYEGGRCQ